MKPYDLIVLGAGNAGVAAASVAKQAGWSVLLVEARDVGGTCPLRGCVPKKVLVAAAEVLDTIGRAKHHGIEVGEARLDWRALIEREQSFVLGVPDEFEASLRRRGIDVLKGEGHFVDRRIVEVNGERYEGRKILIATGSKPRPLDFPGAERLITSEDILSNPEQPESIVFIGAGVVAMELGHVLARAGTQVTMLEAGDRPLGALDVDAVARLVKHSQDLGISIQTGVTVTSVDSQDGGLRVEFEQKGKKHTVDADRVANGAGRIPNLDRLQLPSAQVEMEGGRVITDEQLRSKSNPFIYFAGDALHGTLQLSPVATHEGRVVGRNIIGLGTERPDYASTPSVVFTVPALAQVGLTEAQAKAREVDVTVVENDLTGWRSARTYAEQTAYAKIVLENDTGKILGAHLLGHGSQETIHAFAFAIRQGLGRDFIAEASYAYPTFHSDLKNLV